MKHFCLLTAVVLFLANNLNLCAQLVSASLNSSDYKKFLTGRFNPDSCIFFEKLLTEHCNKKESYLQKEAYKAYKKMHEAAKADGIQLKIISATRNFSKQKQIWETKWTRKDFVMISPDCERAKKIMKFSSMPGTSRHHWGTDIDLNVLNNEELAKGDGKKLYDWLLKNAHRFGFCQVYSAKGEKRTWGYEEEKWHWSYLPLAKTYVSDYLKLIKPNDISGYSGSDCFEQMEVLKKYVLGLNPECMKN